MTSRKNKVFVKRQNNAPWLPRKMTLLMSTSLVLSGCATFQTAPDATDRLLQKINEQDQKIAERDKAISDLTRRIQNLENRTQALAAAPQPSSPTPTTSVAAAQTSPARATATAATRQPQSQQASDQQPTRTASAKPGIGSFEVDENLAQRALERTLVQSGALLLPAGFMEVQPFVTYTRRETDLPFLTQNQFFPRVRNRNEFEMGANVLIGLPFESQLELRIPYRSVNQSTIDNPFGSNASISENTGNSIGDVRIGIAKTLMHETEWLPDLIGRVVWDTATSDVFSNTVFMGSGFHDFSASLTALKRQDPLAFTARISYQASLERQGFKPGDQASLIIGATLAASPQTSLSLGLQQIYAKALKENGIKRGDDQVVSLLTFGASSTIGRNLFLSASAGIGLTDTSPDYFFNLMLPYRFDLSSTYRELTR